PPVDVALVRRLHERAGASRWGLSERDFGEALARSATRRFRGESPSARDVERYLESLHLADLALACACARGSHIAWEHFVREFRPGLRAAAAACAPPHLSRELADSIYGDLFGMEERDDARQSLLDYFHGRSTLIGWLRAVLAQRVVDRIRKDRRLEPLEDPDARQAAGTDAPDPDRRTHLASVRAALAAALAALGARDRLRLALYYTQQMTLAAVGRTLGESEATVSRKLERTRRDLRQAIERRLREHDGFTDAQIAACFEYGREDPAFDLARALPPPNRPPIRAEDQMLEGSEASPQTAEGQDTAGTGEPSLLAARPPGRPRL
ncbi:MAG: sigma-70 family RNA polymerase sigma factor, partial [Acidobacteria bacterium]|nr:sigma-70 family RNA polymerase sigma factor [Acidobacteriota bacterium]